MSKVLYVAGPMTGIPHFNFPLFDAVSAALRDQGYTIISPAETDHEKTRAAAVASLTGDVAELAQVEGAESWGDCLARDVKMLADGFDADVEESDADFRARVKAAAKAWAKANPPDENNVAAPMPPMVRTVTRSTLKIDGIALLPGWEKSRGARLEAFVGLLTGKEYFTVERVVDPEREVDEWFTLSTVTPEWVQHMLALSWADAILMHRPL